MTFHFLITIYIKETIIMTQEEAQELYEKYNGKAGRRPSIYYQALEVLKIESKQVKKKDIYIEFREKYVQHLISLDLTTDSHFLLLKIILSPNNNSLGIFEMSIDEMSYQTLGMSKERIIKAINNLIVVGEVRYYDGVVYLNNKLKIKKQHGNKDNLIGIIKQYNSLADNHKLPYLASINYQQMNMEQVITEFLKIKKGIECMGVIASGRDVVISDYADVYNEEQLRNIVENDINNYKQTI